ncbi:Conserved_hypothetical protein [Hexamita inflata]|uniref:Uncharacterized protein n=1 Tax=Hexamita inflata TaxID=28002 RepID=A0AA86PQ02_9EUKA|nr:Conserved hypothetical protein [Hexamita inflata]
MHKKVVQAPAPVSPPAYLQSFRDFFFKHFEDGYLYAYAVKQAFKFDMDLKLIETQPCKFDSSHFGANWYPAIPMQNAYYGIYDKKLYMMKDFNIQNLSEAPHVSGFGYSYLNDQFIVAYDPGLAHWFVMDITGKYFSGKWVQVQDVWNRAKMLLHHYNGEIYVVDMLTSDFLVLRSFDPERMTFSYYEIKQAVPVSHKWVGSIYESLFSFVCENDQGIKENNVLIDVSQNPPKFYKTKTYQQLFHNTYIKKNHIFSKFGVNSLQESIEAFGMNFEDFKIRIELNKALSHSRVVQEVRKEINHMQEVNHKQDEVIQCLRQELADCKYVIQKLVNSIKQNAVENDEVRDSRSLSMIMDRVIGESQQQIHGGGIGVPEEEQQQENAQKQENVLEGLE